MKTLIVTLLLIPFLYACSNSDSIWEYKVLKYGGETFLYYQGDDNSFYSSNFDNPEDALNRLGQEGWELISTYTTTETVFPNFGKAEYVTGIRENTRTRTINFILKRKAGKHNDVKISPVETAVEEVVVETPAEVVEEYAE